ncbi:hypothetical protein LH462_06785 [Laribacter hongkongensis]|uniref:Uncharacterized protein n=1 Tax=Laribacter hongkongensis TaxID=168471 RepID=A0ABD4SRG8_9NEIS|nr:hypothetical protein [Laribacter hongkongensis]MCG9025184.1 hypothetical protein [Laribacter hongkongensis]MCG9099772.1 hypothetical protein [Laribacter hongkongensis]MCG9103426.1 hypothetical protein [Laribacter hongkongensis]MCG9111250.1 hypothetical protein [Laribacter hongkongensis]MCG9118594.1 hypothetical protein [Laribacter hongkongensis]
MGLLSSGAIARIRSRVAGKDCDKKKSSDPDLQKKREQDRERQARYRDKQGGRNCSYGSGGGTTSKKKTTKKKGW